MSKKLNEIEWSKLLKVDSDLFFDWFNLKEEVIISKDVKLKFYSLKYASNFPNDEGFIKHLYKHAEYFVFDEKDIQELKEDGVSPSAKALSYFGDVDPNSDGKYGELILYLFVEAVLKTPMVVHKIAQTYNDNDQVKGSDGLFIGNINGNSTLLIGESKMRNDFHKCVGDVIESLKRYIDNPKAIDRELYVAKRQLSDDLNNLEEGDLNLIYNSLRTNQLEFQQYDMCYPSFLMYKEDKIGQYLAKNLPEIENQVLEFIKSVQLKRSEYIHKLIPDVPNITFEFFMMPVQDVNLFRKLCYKIFHSGKDYVKSK